MRTSTSMSLLLAGAFAACNSSHGSLPDPRPVQRQVALHAFTDCGALETAIEDAVVIEMRSQLELERQGWGWVGVEGGVAPASPGTAAAPAAGPSAFTTTNAQVNGVAEADFVQNDGTRIVVLSGNTLYAASSWPAESLALVGSLKLDGWPREMLLSGNQVVVFSQVYDFRLLETAAPICLAAGLPCPHDNGNSTLVTLVDITTLAKPTIVGRWQFPGRYLTSRRIGEQVRLVLNDDIPFPVDVQFWPQLGENPLPGERDAAFRDLETKNEALIRAQALDGWLRRGIHWGADGQPADIGYRCQDFSQNTGPTRPGILTLATLNLASQTLASSSSILAQAGTVYASHDTLYVASEHWWWWPEPGQTDATYLHAFDISQPDEARYLGSGVVDGHPVNQYSMDAAGGFLRIATTLGTREADGTPWGRMRWSNRISTLGLKDSALAVVGQTEPFAPDERIFASRFVGNRGFLVTAQSVDPLFTFDLSDPTRPRKVGELVLPGFGTYLHPVDDTHLVSVGTQPKPDHSGASLQVTLFDVSDLAHPAATSTLLLGTGWSWSEALWDPKAFTYFSERGLLAVPFADWNWTNGWSSFVSDLRLVRVDVATGLSPAGSLSMADVYERTGDQDWSFYWSPLVRRGVLADDFVYAISDAGIRSARVADLPAWLATAVFTPLRTP